MKKDLSDKYRQPLNISVVTTEGNTNIVIVQE